MPAADLDVPRARGGHGAGMPDVGRGEDRAGRCFNRPPRALTAHVAANMGTPTHRISPDIGCSHGRGQRFFSRQPVRRRRRATVLPAHHFFAIESNSM